VSDSTERAERRRLIAALELAIRCSVPPTTMPGYWRTFATWLRIARAIGITSRREFRLWRVYRDAAERACIMADLQRQEDEICGRASA